jgi:hypothetical protein
VEDELSQRRIGGAERLLNVAAEDERHVLGAPVAVAQDLATALPEVPPTEPDEPQEGERDDEGNRQLPLAYRREPQVPSARVIGRSIRRGRKASQSWRSRRITRMPR